MEFRTRQFEGPLDLLLSLIEERKMSVTDVSLSTVTEQYLAEVRAHRADITLEHLAGFLSVAARLILLKSRALLPLLVLERDEDDDDEIDLATQLALYERYATAATALGRVWMTGRQSHARNVPPRRRQRVLMPPPGVDTDRLAALFASVIGGIPRLDQLDRQHLRDVVAIEERMMALTRTIGTQGHMVLSQMVTDARNRTDAVISFLAILELLKQGMLVLALHDDGEDATLTPVTDGVLS